MDLRLPRPAPCSRQRAHNTPSEKRTTTEEETSSRLRRSTTPLSTSCRSKGGSTSYAIRPLSRSDVEAADSRAEVLGVAIQQNLGGPAQGTLFPAAGP
jgi:hypothetical protein